MTYAVGFLNPYYNMVVFVKRLEPGGGWSMTQPVDHPGKPRETLADALLLSEAKARAILDKMPVHSFVIACTVADQEMIRAMIEGKTEH